MKDLTRRLWAAQDRHPGDRKRLFSALAESVEVSRVLYPGCFVDLAAAFVFDDVTFVDVDRRAARFFEDAEGVGELIAEHRDRAGPPSWRFVHGDYTGELPVADQQVDLLISLYAGPVSDACTRYLRPGGLLLANPSHGDVAMADLNPDYRLVAVVDSRPDGYVVRRDGLEGYLRPKRPRTVTAQSLRTEQRGIAYTRSAFAYVFELAIR